MDVAEMWAGVVSAEGHLQLSQNQLANAESGRGEPRTVAELRKRVYGGHALQPVRRRADGLRCMVGLAASARHLRFA